MTIRVQQLTSIPRIGPQQVPAVPMQVTTVPATTALQTGFDISAIMNLMITMMIVVMMMKMMTGAMAGVSA